MAGLNLGGGMGTLGTASFGSGFMQGMDKARQHRREDESDAMRQQQHGLQMRQGEQSYSQREQIFPEQMRGLQLGNESAGLQVEQSQRKNRYEKMAESALLAAQAAQQGDWSKANDWSMSLGDDVDSLIWMSPNEHSNGAPWAARKSDVNHENPVYFNSPLEAVQAFYKNADPKALERALTAEPKEREQNWSSINKEGYAIDSKSGQVKKVHDGNGGKGGSGGGGMKYTDENILNRWGEGYFGKRDETGQFILTQDQKYQAVEAQERAVAMLNASPEMSASEAYKIAVGSVAGGIPLNKAKTIAEQMAEDSGIPAKIPSGGFWGGEQDNPEYKKFVDDTAKELMNTSQGEAQSLYEQIVSGQQRAPQQGFQLNSQAGQQRPQQQSANGPQRVNSKEEVDRLPIGTQFITPDGIVRIKQ